MISWWKRSTKSALNKRYKRISKAYKSMDEIVENIEPTAEIICRIKPIYNFKVAE